MIDLSGKSVLITGGSRGIGQAAALLFAEAGADVGVTYRVRRAEAESVVRSVRALGRKGYAGGGDLADRNVVATILQEFLACFGRLDYLVANAGVWPEAAVPLGELEEQRWRHTMATNLDAVYLTCRAALSHMRTGGSVVLVSSTAGQRGEAFHADYAATKGGIIALTKSLAVEYAPDITVNCVAPGWVDTDMSASALAGDGRSAVTATIPLRRIASAADIAGPILFLCSHLARHITGEVLNVNGGSVLCG